MSLYDLDREASEFAEAYDEPTPASRESFGAELLEQSVEVLGARLAQCVPRGARLDEVVEGMRSRNQGCVMVTEDEVLIGILTERDLLRKVVGQVDPATLTVGDVMTPDPEAVSFHDSIAVVLNKMAVGGFRHVPLVDVKLRPVGIVSMRDIVGFFVERFPRGVLTAPIASIPRPDAEA
jgi:CBS domain-containing protein